MKRFTFFTEDDHVPQYWFLVECVWWIAVQRIPYPTDCVDRGIGQFRNEGELPRGPALSETNILALEPEYTELLNISPSPMRTANDYRDLPVIQARLAELLNLDQSYPSWGLAADRESEIRRLEDQAADQIRWLKEHRAALDEPVTKLLSALKSGRLKAYGRKMMGESIVAAETNQRQNSVVFDQLEPKLIQSSAWSLANTAWDDCVLQTEHHLFAGIEIHRDTLLAEFPPLCEQISDGGACDGLIITSTDQKFTFADETEASTRSGRPTKSWDAFYIELMGRFIRGNLPTKQSAAAYELRIWFRDELGENVGLSTIAEKLSPFYREFMKH